MQRRARDAAAGSSSHRASGRSRAGTAARPPSATSTPAVDQLVDRRPASASATASSSVRSHPGAEQRSDVERPRAGRDSPSTRAEHRVARRTAGSRLPVVVQHLGDEERVAAGEVVQLVGAGGRMPVGERGDGRLASAAAASIRRVLRSVATARPRRPRSGSPAARLVVAVGHQQQGRAGVRIRRPRNRSRSSVASSAQCTSSNDQHRRCRVGGHELGEQGPDSRLARGAVASSVAELAAELRGRCRRSGAERPRREQPVAGSPGPAASG